MANEMQLEYHATVRTKPSEAIRSSLESPSQPLSDEKALQTPVELAKRTRKHLRQ